MQGAGWREGQSYTRPALAATLERLAEAGDRGAELFYNGSLGRELVTSHFILVSVSNVPCMATGWGPGRPRRPHYRGGPARLQGAVAAASQGDPHHNLKPPRIPHTLRVQVDLLASNLTLVTVPPPGSGAVLAAILNIMQVPAPLNTIWCLVSAS